MAAYHKNNQQEVVIELINILNVKKEKKTIPKTCMSWVAPLGVWLPSHGNRISTNACPKVNIVWSCCSKKYHFMRNSQRQSKKREETNRLASNARSSLPIIRDIMWLEMGIPVSIRKSWTRFQSSLLRHVSFLATITAAAKLYLRY